MWPFTKKQKTARRRSFNAATYDRLVAGWITSSNSIDADIRAGLIAIRNRSRDLAQNNDYMKNFLRTVRDNVVGENGITFQAQVKMQRGNKLDEATNALIEREWARWCKADSCHTAGIHHFVDIEQLLMWNLPKDGEYIVRFVYQAMGSSKVPLALEIVDVDRLDVDYNGRADGTGNEVRMGVEVNEWKRPVAYHFLSKHPSDISTGSFEARAGRRIRIPADEILHRFIFEGANQSRGIPWVVSAIKRLHHMGGYEEAEVIAARGSASLMGFIESPEEEVSVEDDVQDGQSVTEFEPGIFKKLNPGEKVSIPNVSRPGGQFDPFMRLMLRGVAAGAGVSYEALSKDYSQSNYSSSRLALIDDRSNWRTIQKWMIRSFHQVVFEKWLELAVLSGVLKLKGYETAPELYQGVKWMPRGWAWIDPEKEVGAYKSAVRSGFMTVTEVIAQGGGDLEETFDIREREMELAKEKGIMLDTDPMFVSNAGVTQARPAGSAALDPENPQPDPPPEKKPRPGFGKEGSEDE